MKKTRFAHPLSRSRWSQALLPGLHIKRWIVLLLLGVTLAGLGLAFLIQDMYVTRQLPAPVYWIALTWLPDWLRGLLLLGLGLAMAAAAVFFLNASLLKTLLPGSASLKNLEMVDAVLRRQARRQGPKIVAIGGGTGMPQLLRGLRQYTDNITAIVTVADDGGSSGRLRRQMGMLPPGDFRNNIAALSEAEDLMTRLFQYRFADQEIRPAPTELDAENGTDPGVESGDLAGHSFGNLFIATMAAVTGSFESGIAESSRVLAVRGRVLPSTLEQLTLCAEVSYTDAGGREQWAVVEGESNITHHPGRIERVYLTPENARAYPATLQAILQADLIVAGPGSFFTSVMPNLLVPAIRNAIAAARAPRIYVCNVATQPGETDGYSVTDHMRQLRLHTGDAFTIALANDNFDSDNLINLNTEWVSLPAPDEALDYQIFTGDLVESARPWRHDPHRLAQRLIELYEELRTHN